VTKGELLLQWLTHVHEGTWGTFRRAVSAVEAEDADGAAAARRLRIRLSEMSHVEFFIDGGSQWRTLAPLLGGLWKLPQAVLSGGRTPRLVDSLARSCEREGCRIEASDEPGGPDSIRVIGPTRMVSRAARGAGLPYLPDIAGAMSAALKPITADLRSAPPSAGPINWDVRSFDLAALKWVDGILPNTAYEYRSRHGGMRHYVRGPRLALLPLDRRRAVYAAAHLNGIALLSYSEHKRCLMVPKGAPLPESMARTAAACAGKPAAEHDGHLAYVGVPPVIAGVLLVAAGQRPPAPQWLPEQRSVD
jgi:hypothetical protein